MLAGKAIRMATVVCVLALLLGSPAQARITKIQINATVPGQFGFGAMITGTAYGEVDPQHPLNTIIQDVDLAPRNESGMVEYSMKFTILKPPGEGNGLMFYEVVNRGFPVTVVFFPRLLNLLRERGYTVVWSGWQGDLVPINPLQHTLQVPVATQGAEEIVGRVRTEYEVEQPTNTQCLSGSCSPPHSSYMPVNLDRSDAILTKRMRQADTPQTVSTDDWRYADCTSVPFPGTPSSNHVCLKDGFDPEYFYELIYAAKNPLVLGLGFAATRDLVSFLRYSESDAFGTPNPIAESTSAAIMQGASQSGRFIRTYLQLGFNEDEDGRVVFEGMNPHLGPARIAMNIRFGQPGRSTGPRADHLKPGWEAPLTWMPSRIPFAGSTVWLLERCRMTNTCPKILQTMSSTEYWGLRASVNTTDALARHDVGLPGNVRMYLFSSTQHVPASDPPGYGICQQLHNPNDYVPYLNALIVALERWIVEGKKPPKSQIPTVRDGTLVSSEKATIGWPDIPNVKYTGVFNSLPLINYGVQFNQEDETSILYEPPIVLAPGYTVLVPKVDEDGNEVAGIRSTKVQAPLGTYTGWNLRRAGFAEDELCGPPGSFIPFAETKAEREASGDPRLSLEERYSDHDGYVEAVRRAAEQLVEDGFLLLQDAEEIVQEAEDSDVLR